jgi:5'-nucleotidase
MQHENVVICKKDPQLQSLLQDKYIPRVRELQSTVIANLTKDMRHIRIPDQQGGSEIVPLVAESFAHMMNKDGHQIDFAIHNAGGVRQSLNKGEVTLAYVIGRLLPFDLPLVHYEIQGLHLFSAIESAINSATNNSVTGTGAGSFPYTYGLKYCYDGRKPLGERILSLEVFDKDGISWICVDKQATYFGVSSAYTVSGKEGYTPLLQAETQEPIEDLTLSLAFIRYLQREQSQLEETLIPHVHYTSHLTF